MMAMMNQISGLALNTRTEASKHQSNPRILRLQPVMRLQTLKESFRSRDTQFNSFKPNQPSNIPRIIGFYRAGEILLTS